MPTDHVEKSAGQSGTRNILMGIGAGVGATIVGTALWFLIAQKYKMPLLSIAIAFGIAYAMRYAGRVTMLWFGLVGALLSGLMAIAGSVVTGFYILKIKYPTMSLVKTISELDVENAVTFLKIAGMPLSTLCILVSAGIGFWFSIKHIPKKPMELPD